MFRCASAHCNSYTSCSGRPGHGSAVLRFNEDFFLKIGNGRSSSMFHGNQILLGKIFVFRRFSGISMSVFRHAAERSSWSPQKSETPLDYTSPGILVSFPKINIFVCFVWYDRHLLDSYYGPKKFSVAFWGSWVPSLSVGPLRRHPRASKYRQHRTCRWDFVDWDLRPEHRRDVMDWVEVWVCMPVCSFIFTKIDEHSRRTHRKGSGNGRSLQI